MRKILLIGNGAREHALAEALINSKHQVELYAFGQAINPGIKQLSIQYKVGSSSDFEAISAFSRRGSFPASIVTNAIVKMNTTSTM